MFEGEKGRKYAGVIARIVESVQAGLEEVNGGGEESSETVSGERKCFETLVDLRRMRFDL